MASLRPHKHFNFVGLWKYGFILSSILIALALAGLITSAITTGSPLRLGTEFSGGTSITLNNTGDLSEENLKAAFSKASSDNGGVEISSVQTTTNTSGESGFIVKLASTESASTSSLTSEVTKDLELDSKNVSVDTISASWGSSVIWSSILAFILSCLAILLVITFRYRDPRMGVVALITLFHDLIIVIGVYAWAGMFAGMEVTSDVIAALLAIIGYSLYDTIVIFHRINLNSSATMTCSLKTCANRSVNEVIMRSLNTSVTSILPVLLMLILGTDTLRDFAFAMFAGMICGIYSTLAISAPIYTLWKTRDPKFAKLEKKYAYEVVQSPFTKEMNKAVKAEEKAEALAAKKAAAATKSAKADASDDRASDTDTVEAVEEKSEQKASEKSEEAPAADEAQATDAEDEE